MNSKDIAKLGSILYKHLNVSDWEEVFRLCELDDYLNEQPRFIRSLKWSDDDAKGNCFKAVEHLYSHNSEEFFAYINKKPQVVKAIRSEIPDCHSEILSASNENEETEIDVEEAVSTNRILREAIDDAEILLENDKPANAYDRVFTALHGVLKQKCSEKSITIGETDTVSSIIGKIREYILEHGTSYNKDETAKIIGSVSKIINILNDMRNKNSLAHPNERLLDNNEALFCINISKAIMCYVNDLMG